MTQTVNQWLEYLESLHPSEIELGLDRIKSVGEQLNCLKPASLVILVAGTNGKGTTSALLANLLMAQGMTVGVYSSPHIQRYNERVQINGEQISDNDLIHSFELVEQQRGDTGLTYFEFGTLAALAYFQSQSQSRSQPLDACVLEIGLGGRLDAVNIVDADISLVTSIGLDHQDWLGDTVEQIAFEKCGVARSGKYLVCGQPNPPHTAQQQTESLGGQWCTRGQHFDIVEEHDELLLSFMTHEGQAEWNLPKANIPYHNVATAIQALSLLGRLPNRAVVADVVANTSVPGRLQQVAVPVAGGELKLTLDVAHNQQAAGYIAERLGSVDGAIIGMLEGKPVAELLNTLPDMPQYWLAGLDCWRGLSAAQLAEQAGELPSLVTQFDQVADALEQLLQQDNLAGQHWLIAGSFYTVEAALNYLQQQD